MSKFVFHNQPLGVDTAVTINYDMKELMQGIAEQMNTISWAVMGKEVCGAVFVSFDPENQDKLITHGSMVRPEYNGQPLQSDSYLWVVIDQLDNAYRARFLTPECVNSITKSDLTPRKTPMDVAEDMIEGVAKRSFINGFAWGGLVTLIVAFVTFMVIYFIF